mmetsp:Transcript_21232/g.49424  ORF Transcript_21232/g.49424 Transcript_21232/m.49424 type:complete len:202 (+) Transcript_21232:335-940(+)
MARVIPDELALGDVVAVVDVFVPLVVHGKRPLHKMVEPLGRAGRVVVEAVVVHLVVLPTPACGCQGLQVVVEEVLVLRDCALKGVPYDAEDVGVSVHPTPVQPWRHVVPRTAAPVRHVLDAREAHALSTPADAPLDASEFDCRPAILGDVQELEAAAKAVVHQDQEHKCWKARDGTDGKVATDGELTQRVHGRGENVLELG